MLIFKPVMFQNMILFKAVLFSTTIYIIESKVPSEVQTVDPQTRNTEVFEGLSTIYYDMEGKPVPLLPNQPGSSPSLKAQTLNFGRLPCSCQDSICGCCAHMNVQSFNFHRDACMNFTYVPKDFAINMDMFLNDQSLYHNSISGKNPPPACIPITMVPGLSFCLRFHDLYSAANNMHMCVNFETNYATVPLLVLQFRCFQIGQDGFNLDQSFPGNNTSASPPSSPADPPILGADVYDEVTEEKKKINENKYKSENTRVLSNRR